MKKEGYIYIYIFQTKRVVLESENIFFMGKKDKYGDPWLLRKGDE